MPIDFSFLDGAQKESASTQTGTANVTIRVDADSLLLCDGEYIDHPFKAGVITKIQLPLGQHLLEFLYAEDPDIKIEKEVDFPESGKSYLVLIKGMADLTKTAAEVKPKDATEGAEAADTCVIPEGIEALESMFEFRKYYKGESKVRLPSTLKKLGGGPTIFGNEGYDDRQKLKKIIKDLYDEHKFEDASKLEEKLAKEEEKLIKILHLDMSRCTKLESIGERTFAECYYLSKVILPNSLREIPKDAFEHCRSLKEIVIPQNVKIIRVRAFRGCCNLTKVHFENSDSLRTIQAGAFRGCVSLKEIVIPHNVKIIGERAFESCSNLKKVHFENFDVLREIPRCAFKLCRSLEEIVIPHNVTIIGERAFEGCRNLKKVHFENCDSLREIQAYAFRGCNSLEEIVIPQNVNIVGESAFEECLNLKKVHFENSDSLREIQTCAFRGCNSLEEIVIPQNAIIGYNAFLYCKKLEEN